MKVLSFLVDNELFCADVRLVEKVTRKMILTQLAAAPHVINGLVNLKGRVITAFNLYQILGRKERRNAGRKSDTVNAIVFNSFSGEEDQMCLIINKPGELIELDDETVSPPVLATGAEESFCISGIAEKDNKLYRIIDIDSIINRYKTNGVKTVENTNRSNGGLENGE